MNFRSRLPLGTGLFAVCIALAGCSTEDTNYSQYFQLLRQSWSQTVSNGGVSRDQAAKIPYASIGYRLDGGQENLLVLATDSGSEQLWTSGSHVVLVTRDGRLVRTAGLASNIASVTPLLSASLVPPRQALKNAFTSMRTADFPEDGRYSVPIRCKTVNRGRAAISILGKTLQTIRADESCESIALRWSFRDSYWIDAESGFVWRSIQHLTPKGQTIEIEVLRPPG